MLSQLRLTISLKTNQVAEGARKKSFTGLREHPKKLLWCSVTPSLDLRFKTQSRKYHTSITSYPFVKNLPPGTVDSDTSKLVRDLLSIGDVKSNAFFSADLGPYTGDIVSRQLLDVLKNLGIPMPRVTQIVCADKATGAQYRQSVLRLLDDFPDIGTLLVVGGSSANGRILTPEQIRGSAQTLIESARKRNIKVGAVANTNLPYDHFMNDITFKLNLGVSTFFTQPYFGCLDRQVEHFLEDMIKAKCFDVCFGVITASQSLFDNRIITETESRKFNKAGGATFDRYKLRDLTAEEKALSAETRWREYTKANVGTLTDWMTSLNMNLERSVYTRARSENEWLLQILAGTNLSYTPNKNGKK